MEEEAIKARLRAGDEAALEEVFHAYYANLCRTVYRVLPDAAMAEDLVQEVFYELWRKRANLEVKHGLGAYLRRAAVNKTLNYIRDQKLALTDEAALPPDLASSQPGAAQQLETNELRERMHAAIDALPERCRLVFVLSRFEEYSNQEIADRLGIRVKTVENQMTKALRLLRSAIEPYLSLWAGILGWLFYHLYAC